MSKTIFIFLAAIFLQCSLPCYSQVTNDARFNLLTPGIRQWFRGWYITMEDDTVQGYIYLSNQIDNQSKFEYSSENPPGMELKMLKASVVKGYFVKDRVYESLQIESEKNAEPAFIRRLETGQLNLFAWYNLPAYGTMHDAGYDRPISVNDEKFHESVYILKMGSAPPFLVPTSKNFAEVMSSVVADNKDLSQRIAQKLKGYRSGDLLNIVQQYNASFNHRQ